MPKNDDFLLGKASSGNAKHPLDEKDAELVLRVPKADAELVLRVPKADAELVLRAPKADAERVLRVPKADAERVLRVPKADAELVRGVPREGRGWHSRGYLPHLDVLGLLQFITFRLADSLPQTILAQLEEELTELPDLVKNSERRRKIEHWLDAGLGCCALKHPAMARVMQEGLLLFDGKRYRLIAWCIMPNHVHVLIEPMISLSKIVQSWKSYTGRWALAHNAELVLGVPSDHFWMSEYWDRYIRDEAHFNNSVKYIHENPVKAGLCGKPGDWPWSSAYPKSF